MIRYVATIENGLMAMTIGLSMVGCREPFEPEAVDFNSALVIEATITDDNKYQEILISRTFALDTTGIYGEFGAEVKVTDTKGAIYNFMEAEEGTYVSSVPFAAQAGIGYSLSVVTYNGSTYSSDEVIAPQPTSIDSLYAERDFKDDDIYEGIYIYVDSYDKTGSNHYYKYDYEETYKIVAPFWTNKEAYITEDDLVAIRIREKEGRVCYKTNKSIELIKTNTRQLSENRISKFPIRFIDRNEYLLSHRYSILVRQYVESRQAYNYDIVLDRLTSSENLFTQVQPGFLEGNIYSLNNRQSQEVGYFKVSSVLERRIFFDYIDFFKGEALPPFVVACPFVSNVGTLKGDIERDATAYWDDNNGQYGLFIKPAPWIFVDSKCGDCTKVGSNIKPDFWVD